MKKTVLFIGGLLCLSSWQAYAGDYGGNTSATTRQVNATSEGAPIAGGGMSGGPAASNEKTRAQVYQELLQSQRDGEEARLRDLYRGGN